MSKQNITAWFFEGGSVSIPRHLLGLMEPLGLHFDDLGKILYLLYCGTNQVKKNDSYAMEAVQSLQKKNFIHWYADTETVDFSPMFDKISENLGGEAQYLATEQSAFTSTELNYAQIVKQLEQKLGTFLSLRDKQNLQEVQQLFPL